MDETGDTKSTVQSSYRAETSPLGWPAARHAWLSVPRGSGAERPERAEPDQWSSSTCPGGREWGEGGPLQRRAGRWHAPAMIPCVATALVLVTLGGAPDASADAAARLAVEAVEAQQAGDLAVALQRLHALHALHPGPRILNNIGRLSELLGNYQAAFEAYLAVADDPAAPGDLRALDASRAALLQPRLDRAWIRLDRPDARLFVDALPARAEPGAEELPAAPGTRTLEVASPDGASIEADGGHLDAGRRYEVAAPGGDRACAGAVLVVDRPLAALSIEGYELQGDLSAARIVCAGQSAARVRAQPEGGKEALLATLEAGRRTRVSEMPRLRVASPAAPTLDPWPIVAGAAGLAAGIAGGALLGHAAAVRADLRGGPKTADGVSLRYTMREADRLESQARAQVIAGGVVAGVGAACVAAAVVLWLVEGEPAAGEPRVVVAPWGVAGRF